jgi:hypothetical protein
MKPPRLGAGAWPSPCVLPAPMLASGVRGALGPVSSYNVYMSEVVSVRLSNQIAQRLRERAAADNEALSGLAQRLLDEGLRMETHPGVIFRRGPSGRRAALPRGPDIWEVVHLLRSIDARGEAAIAEAASWLDLTQAQVRTALDYYGAFPDEINAQIAVNEAAAEQARRESDTQQQLLG